MVDCLLKGSRHEIHYIREGTRTFQDWVDDQRATGPMAAEVRDDPSISDRSVSPPEWKKLLAACKRIAQHGYQQLAKTNVVKTWVDYDGTEVAEIRKGGIRVFFFEEEPVPDEGPSRLILTHGYRKQTDETPDREIEHFIHLREQYYRQKFDAE
ncbi:MULTISPECIES: type II toxin-antitoxin system RelE/ParE family toxin [Salinibacter]|uniref:type II toxin-antitoxin system RelE/ParE family toxin n=1 Tax=Salinibacter TaxID=146918 RepID=UPI0021E91061|nr:MULTISPECIES: type II toxin-antitoxin system RelE/ParE family toxin [Salinibacter]